jgi:hypothetical protein
MKSSDVSAVALLIMTERLDYRSLRATAAPVRYPTQISDLDVCGQEIEQSTYLSKYFHKAAVASLTANDRASPDYRNSPEIATVALVRFQISSLTHLVACTGSNANCNTVRPVVFQLQVFRKMFV